MADRPAGAPPPIDEPTDNRLDSWKAIASYLNRDVTTVQRWEKREGMPVRRHVHDKVGSVYAFRSELDAWTRGRSTAGGEGGGVLPEERGVPAATDLVDAPRRRPGLAWALAAGAALAGVAATGWLLVRADYFWRNPLDNARFENVTDFGGTERAAAISRDGRLVAFLSDREGRTDVWVTQLGTGRFYNLTRGRMPELANPAVRELGFSPDGSLVTFWARTTRGTTTAIGIWSIPVLGGAPEPYVEGAAEFSWSADGSRLVYHTPGPGDPTFVRESAGAARQIFAAAPGLHAHYPVWAADGRSIFFVQGTLPDAMDIWRIPSNGGAPRRITYHNSRVSYPVFLNDRTLAYLATGPDGSGPWIYSVDVKRRLTHRLTRDDDRYASLSASGDGRRLVATRTSHQGTLWRLTIGEAPAGESLPTTIAVTTRSGFSPRLAPGYLVYGSSKGAGDSLWKLENGSTIELWSAPNSRIVGGPDISPDGARIVFSTERNRQTVLVTVNADGTDAREITGALTLRGAPSWSPDGLSITTAVVGADLTPRVARIALNGAATPLVRDYSVDPAWSPDGGTLMYSDADIGTTFRVKAMAATGAERPLPAITLTRGSRRLRFVDGGRAIVVLRGDLQHKDLWAIDLESGAERRLTALPAGFDVRDFDISPDGREIVFERVEERSGVVLFDLGPRS